MQKAIPLLLIGFIFGSFVWAADVLQAEIPAPKPEAAATRAAFLKLIDRPKVPADFESKDTGEADGVAHTHFAYSSFTGVRVPGTFTDKYGALGLVRVPGIWAKPAKATGRLPVVILLHGTGGKKEDFKAEMDKYAHAGFFAIAIDGPFHGERASPGAKGADYEAAVLAAWRTGKGHPFFYDTVWDVMRLVDYLQTRDDVDPKRIGLTGVSKGGIETYLTAAVDPRIAVAVPYISVESFRYALNHEVWSHRTETIQTAIDGAAKDAGVAKVDADFVRKFYDKVAPGIYGQFDGPAMVPLIAPRPLLSINGEIDPRTPRPGVDECLNAAQPLYDAAQMHDALKYIAEPKTPHKVTPEGYAAGLAWFKQWLKPTAP